VRRLLTSLLILAGLGLGAEAAPSYPSYRIGDMAGMEVTTPVALDVVNPAATVALRATKAREVPVVFRSFPVATNGLRLEFMAVFTRAQANFLTALAAGFPTQKVDAAIVASPEFQQFYNRFSEHSRFPVPAGLAAEWAQGGDGGSVRDRLLGQLQQVSARPVRPDELPEGFTIGKSVRLVAVTAADQKLSLEDVQRGRLTPGDQLISVSQAQKVFAESFSATEQPCARAVAALLKPDSFPDVPLTELTANVAVCQLVATEHIDAGATILHRGDRVDARTKAALDALNDILVANTARAADTPPSPAPPPAQVKTETKPASEILPVTTRSGAVWVVPVLSAICVVALLLAGWQAWKLRRRAPAQPASAALAYPPEVVTQLTQGVREAVIQELASQRRELLLAQQTAAEEVTQLIRRLDELQLPIQQREEAYEARIHALEGELALRKEENQELLKLKLEIVRRQLQSERAANLN
jgi:hypothetical protein